MDPSTSVNIHQDDQNILGKRTQLSEGYNESPALRAKSSSVTQLFKIEKKRQNKQYNKSSNMNIDAYLMTLD